MEIQNYRAEFEAFHRETSAATVAFRNYWRKESDTWHKAVRDINSILTGETPVTHAGIEECRNAVMYLHQIRYVLGELSMFVGSPNPGVGEAVMHIYRRIDDDTAKATKDLKTILQWQAAAFFDAQA